MVRHSILVVAALAGLSLPAATVRADSSTPGAGTIIRIVLSGSIKGTERRVLSLPDTGMKWRWKGAGTVQPLGQVTATGTNHAVGFVRTGTPTGVIVLTSPSGTLHLALTYPQTRGFAPLPARATYVITAGTGQYEGATGSGVVARRLTPCSRALGGSSCSAASVRPVTYRFVAGGK